MPTCLLNEATLPSDNHPHIFLAQGFDAQDPVGALGALISMRRPYKTRTMARVPISRVLHECLGSAASVAVSPHAAACSG